MDGVVRTSAYEAKNKNESNVLGGHIRVAFRARGRLTIAQQCFSARVAAQNIRSRALKFEQEQAGNTKALRRVEVSHRLRAFRKTGRYMQYGEGARLPWRGF